ncbi:hypothetical protein, partial [Myroides marinus]|uniref:hypothetical protein n=1 Tax=Myroides marinus TaxID=703342 RepID=UPI00257868E2
NKWCTLRNKWCNLVGLVVHYRVEYPINDDLYELTIEKGNSNLQKVPFSRLMVNFYYNDIPSSSIIYVITKSHLNNFLEKMNSLEQKIITKMKSSFE